MKNIDKQAIAEVVEIIQHSRKDIKDKIPESFMKFLYENMDKEYKTNLDFKNENWSDGIKKDTRVIMALIYRDYLVSKEEREELIKKEQEELKNEEEELRKKYNPDKLFEKKETKKEDTINEIQIIEIKESTWYEKIWRKIISFFGKNK